MPARPLRVSIIAVCAVLITGCGGNGSITGSSTGGGGTGGGGTPTTVTVKFTGNSTPVIVAAQIGTGAFAAQTLSAGMLSLSVPSGTNNYAVAYLCPALANGVSSTQYEYVWEASIKDGTSPSLFCLNQPNFPPPNLTGSLDATAIPGVQLFSIDSENGNSTIGVSQSGGSTATFDLPAAVGNDRVLVLAGVNQNQGPLAAKNFDNQAAPGALNGGNTVVFGTADETTPEAITYNNVPSGFTSPNTFVSLNMGGAPSQLYFAGTATTQYPELPPSATESGDSYSLDAGTYTIDFTSQVNVGTTISGGPVSLTFPAPWSYAGPTPAALPSFTIGYTGFSGNSNVTQGAVLMWPYPTSTTNYEIQVKTTVNYQNGSTTLAIPDLSGVAGFLTPPASGTQVGWTAWIEQQSWGLTSQSTLNSTWSQVTNNGEYTVP